MTLFKFISKKTYRINTTPIMSICFDFVTGENTNKIKPVAKGIRIDNENNVIKRNVNSFLSYTVFKLISTNKNYWSIFIKS